MTVSKRDREYFRRIGGLKAESHAAASSAHAALPLDERLRRSWALYEEFRDRTPRAKDDDPTALYDRARALGLYRG